MRRLVPTSAVINTYAFISALSGISRVRLDARWYTCRRLGPDFASLPVPIAVALQIALRPEPPVLHRLHPDSGRPGHRAILPPQTPGPLPATVRALIVAVTVDQA